MPSQVDLRRNDDEEEDDHTDDDDHDDDDDDDDDDHDGVDNDYDCIASDIVSYRDRRTRRLAALCSGTRSVSTNSPSRARFLLGGLASSPGSPEIDNLM
ncbi:hypothetical protein ElyMa_003335200 [Elysia marginata]|uniref:Uncharacterized protein n=1 Tax=Elysia marginata TaxID=1093978 RepID=A0AAV4JL51_9GAST|nr:hypothetical protein ElyMa_003335200 [Elysia marginata]